MMQRHVSTLRNLRSFFKWLFLVVTLVLFPSPTTAEDASDYLFFTIEDCALAMTSSDSNTDEMLFFGEFLEAIISLSPFPSCPDIESASNTGSSYRIVFEELQCACLDYPSLDPPTGSFDPICCDRTGSASIRLPLQVYPEAYTERLCRGMELALAADCLEPSTEPAGPVDTPSTGAPTNIPLSELFPTQPPTSKRPSRSPVLSTKDEEDESMLGLSTVWTIFAWIAFAACGLVLLGLMIMLVASFCHSSSEKGVKESDDPNREDEHEIEFEAEEELSQEEANSNIVEQASPAVFTDTSVQEQSHSVDDDDVGDEDYVDAAADEADAADDGGDDDDDREEEEECLRREQDV